MKYVNLLLIIVIISSCNPTRDRRQDNNFSEDNYIATNTNTTSTPTDGAVISNTQTGQTSAPAGYGHCLFDTNVFTKNEEFLNKIDLCQSQTTSREVIIRTNVTSTTRKICVVPTTRDIYNNSFYIGDANCDYLQANTYYKITLNVYNGYESYPLNGAMVMFQDRLQSYTDCIIDQTQNKQSICNTFISQKGYLDFNFTSY